jgi:NTP pyrophosphatase (non-canonical NTP hydrolase)
MSDKKKIISIQEEVKKLYKHNNWKADPTLLLLAIQEELGELVGRWLAEHPDYEKSMESTDPIPEEVGDLIHLILAFCNIQGIDFEEQVRNTIKKRWRKKGKK